MYAELHQRLPTTFPPFDAPRSSIPPTSTAAVHLSVGALLRHEATQSTALAVDIAQSLSAGAIIAAHITVAAILSTLTRIARHFALTSPHQEPIAIIDGFPRSVDNITEYEHAIGDINAIMHIQCPPRVCKDRLLRRAHDSGRSDDTETVIDKRLRTYRDTTAPVIDAYRKAIPDKSLRDQYFFAPINGDDTIANVYKSTRLAYNNFVQFTNES